MARAGRRLFGWILATGSLLPLAIASSAGAGIVVDPDAFPSGTDISHAFPGVTLSTRDGPAPGTNSRAVYSLATTGATTGTRAFAHDGADPTWGDGIFEFLRADFLPFVDSVSLDFFSNDSGGDNNPQLLAFDSGNNQIAISSGGFVPANSFVRLTVSAPNIAYVAAYWDAINHSENGGLDRLEYTVPEPSGMALSVFAASVFTSALARRRNG